MSYIDHGYRHRPGGTDPILDGFIAFDVDNVGGYLHIETNATDGDGKTLLIVASNGGDTYWYPSGLDKDKAGEWWLYGDGGSSIGLSSGGSIAIAADGTGSGASISIENLDDGGTTITDTNGGIEITGDPVSLIGSGSFAGMRVAVGWQSTGITVDLIAGKSLTIRNHSGSEIFKISEAGEVFPHLPASAGTSGSLWNDGGVVSVA